jgi:hypothetical protein
MQISQEALQQAYAEIEELTQQKVKPYLDAQIFDFITKALGDTHSRKAGRMTYDEITVYLVRKGWIDTPSTAALRQRYQREKARRELMEGLKNG